MKDGVRVKTLVEELVCGILQCFGQHIVNGLQALGNLLSGVNLGSFESSKSNRQNNGGVEHE